MIEKPLTIREKKVLCVSLCYPLMKEKDLAKLLGLKLSTYTVIKRRLRNRGYFQKIRTPCLFKMGFDVFVVIYADISVIDDLLEEDVRNLLQELQFGSFSFLSRRHLLVLGFALDYASAVTDYIKLKEFLRERSGRDELKVSMKVFPRQHSAILNFFNLGPSLADFWEFGKLKKEPKRICGMEVSSERPVMSNMGIEAFRALISHPTMKDSDISALLKTSRQVVNKYKKSFEELGYLTTLGITDPVKLGMEVLSARWITYVDRGEGDLLKRLGKVCLKTSQYFMIAGPEQIFTLSLYPDLTTLEVDEAGFLKALGEEGIKVIETDYRILSLPDSAQPTFFEFKKAADTIMVRGCRRRTRRKQ